MINKKIKKPKGKYYSRLIKHGWRIRYYPNNKKLKFCLECYLNENLFWFTEKEIKKIGKFVIDIEDINAQDNFDYGYYVSVADKVKE